MQASLTGPAETTRLYRETLGRATNELGRVLGELQRSEEAEQAFRLTIEIFHQLASEFPDVLFYQSGIAFGNLGNVLRSTNRIDEAEVAYRKNVQMKQQFVSLTPSAAHNRVNLAYAHMILAKLLADIDRKHEAIDAQVRNQMDE